MSFLRKKVYYAIYNWVNHKSLKNFYILYRDTFEFRHIWWRPLFRCWRIFKHTCIDDRYKKIAIDKNMFCSYIDKDMYCFYIEKINNK